MLPFILMIIAVVLFVLAAMPLANPPKVNLPAAGLAFLAASLALQMRA